MTNVNERKLYEFLGIKCFRRFILSLESFKLRFFNKKSRNYHPEGKSINLMRKFVGYLCYNAILHVCSIVLVVVYFIITWITGARYILLDVITVTMMVINIYCIMLQRYIYLRIRDNTEKRLQSRSNHIVERANRLKEKLKNRDKSELLEERSLIERIHNCMESGQDCFITAQDGTVLSRIEKCSKGILFKTAMTHERTQISIDPSEQKVEQIIKNSELIEPIERRASKAQTLFGLSSKDNVLSGFCVATETVECEIAYKTIVQGKTLDSVEMAFHTLLKAYDDATKCQGGSK